MTEAPEIKRSYWSIPGIAGERRTLKDAVQEAFEADFSNNLRDDENSFAKHAWRYILYTELNRLQEDIAVETCCGRPNVSHSVNTARNLMETDRRFYCKVREIIFGVRNGLVI